MSNFIANIKIYLDRSRMYISIIQFFMIGILFFKDMNNDIGIFIKTNPQISYTIIIILFIVLSCIIGWLDKKAGIRKKELEIYSLDDPVRNEILENTRKLLKKEDKI